MIDLLKFKVEEPYKFEPVTQLEFYTYVEDIRKRLKKEMPEWHVNQINLGSSPGVAPTTYYHCCRWDFTKSRDRVWPLTVDQHIFAYIRDEEYFLLNKHPINQDNDSS
jgi:hypothetical protein